MGLLEELRSLGWYLSESGLQKILPSESDKCNDVNEIIKLCLDIDFREIAEGALTECLGETLKGPVVLQLQWSRNIAAPKVNETSTVGRMLYLELSDGQTSIKALEVDKVPLLDLSIPPGTKIRFKGANMELLGDYLLLRNQDIEVIGGNVSSLIEKWETVRSMQYISKTPQRTSATSCPPPWIPFGKSLDAVTESHGLGKERNFKSLQIAHEKDKHNKENEEFNAMRSEAIAEAMRVGTRKVFGGGGQHILDYDIKKILDKGYSEEDARQSLRATNNNLERALYHLKRRPENKPNENSSKPTTNANTRSTAPPRDAGSKKGASKIAEDGAVSTKPVGNVSLFDFLTDKLPANAQKSNEGSEAQKPIQSKQTPQVSAAAVAGRETKVTTTSTSYSSNQQQQQQQQQRQSSEPKTVRNAENRQTSGRYGKPDSTNESNRKERSSGGAGRGGSKTTDYSNRQNSKGNRNSTYNESTNRRAGGESERGGNRRPPANNNSNQNQNQNPNPNQNQIQTQIQTQIQIPNQNQNQIQNQNQNQSTEVNTNAIQSSNIHHQSAGRTRVDNQSNSRSNPNRNRSQQQHPAQQQHQQQYTNVTQKRNYGPLQRPQGISSSMPSSSNTNMNMVVTSSVRSVATVVPAPPPPIVSIATTTLLPNGFAYDPSKIIGFQSKEANEYAMHLMRSQGKTIGLETIVSQGQSNPPQAQPIEYIQAAPPPGPMPVTMTAAMPVAVPVPMPVQVATIAPMRPPHHYGMTTSVSADSWLWKIGDLCMAKYWEDGQYYEAEITAIGDNTCVVYYIGYNNHEEVLKADCLPITDAHHRPINNYNIQQSMQAVPPPTAHTHPPMRTALRYYVPPQKRN